MRLLIPASVTLPEITPKAVVLSIVLAAVLAGANAYLGLFAGMTVSASIPAAVVSMAVLRLFRESNILENNIVQTAASSGEALAAGVIFTIPGLAPHRVLGVVRLLANVHRGACRRNTRRVVYHSSSPGLDHPCPAAFSRRGGHGGGLEGRSFDGCRRGRQVSGVIGSGCRWAAALSLPKAGLKLWSESLEGVVQFGRATLYGGLNLSPALLAVGYIIGLNTAVVVFLGGAVGWLVLLPVYQLLVDQPGALTGLAAAKMTWSGQIRYIGIGAMLVGGVWTLFQVRGPILQSLRQLMALYGSHRQRRSPRYCRVPSVMQVSPG